jgi:hypothetical protein
MTTAHRRITSDALQRVVNMADGYSWTDETYYNDPDCELHQAFVRGPLRVNIVWAGLGTHSQVLSIEVRTSKPTGSRRQDGLLFYREDGDQRQLMFDIEATLMTYQK